MPDEYDFHISQLIQVVKVSVVNGSVVFKY